jgi:uroporphyrinogen decarboxylase
VLEKLDVDFRHVWLSSPDKPKARKLSDGTVVDEWGITWSAEGSYPVHFPLQSATLDEIKQYAWPFPARDWNTEALHERARFLREQTDYAVTAKAVFAGAGILERCTYLRTIDNFFLDLCTNEEIALFLIQKITDVEIALWDVFLDAVGPFIDVVQRASDVGTQTSLMISPELFRKYFKPAEIKVTDFIRKKAPQSKIWFHSCGAIRPLIPDFIDFGVQVLNPVQPLATGMESRGLKRDFGDVLCFHGGIDIQRALPGTLADVRREVELRISSFGPGGGYILGPANHVQKDTPARNIIEMYQHARRYGVYPLATSVGA